MRRYSGTGEYNKTKDDGVYGCAACGTPLYKSTTKFDSGCGWPAFFEGIPGAIKETVSAHYSLSSGQALLLLLNMDGFEYILLSGQFSCQAVQVFSCDMFHALVVPLGFQLIHVPFCFIVWLVPVRHVPYVIFGSGAG